MNASHRFPHSPRRGAKFLNPRRKAAFFAAFSTAALFGGRSAQADTTETVWNPATNNFNTPINWSNGLPSATNSAVFNSTFSLQPTLSATGTIAQGIWAATGLGQDVTISATSMSYALTITGTATLDGVANAGILLDDSANHNLTISAAATLTNSTSFYVNNTGTLTVGALNLNAKTLSLSGTGAGATVLSGVLSGAAGSALSINTANTVTLSGANTFTGSVALTTGTLNLNNATALGNATNVFTISGGTIDNSSGSAKTLGANPVMLSGNFAYSTSAGTTNNNLTLAGAASLTGDRTITLNGLGALTFGGTLTNTSNAARLLTVNNGTGTGTTSALNLTNVALTGSGATAVTTLTIAGSSNVNINGAVSNGTYTTAGSGLAYSGTGSLVLNGMNTFTGGFTLNSGTLFLNGGGNSSAINGTIYGPTGIGGTFTINGGTIVSAGTYVTIANPNPSVIAGTFSYGTAADLVANSLSLGAGTTSITANSTITLNGLGSLTLGAAVTNAVMTSPTLTVNNGSGTGTTTALNLGAYALAPTSSTTAITDTIAGSGNVNITGVISNGGTGANGLTYGGTGTLTLSGTNTYTGTTTVNSGGTLQIGAGGTTGQVGNGTASVVDNGTLILNLSGVFPFANSLSGVGAIIDNGAGAVTLSGTNTSFTGTTAINTGASIELNTVASTPGTITVNSGGTLTALTSGFSPMQLGALLTATTFKAGSVLGLDTTTASITYANNISGTEGLTKLGSNSLTLSGSNTYTGTTLVSAGTLEAAAPSVLPSTNGVANATITVNSGATLAANVASGGFGSTDLDTLLASTTFNPGSALGIDTSTSTFTYSSVISGTEGLIKIGSGTLILTGANTITGTTSFALGGGTLQIGNANALQNSTLSPGNGTVKFSGGIGTFNVGGLTGNNTIALADTASAAVALSIGGNNISNAYTGTLTGLGSLVKVGTGTLSLSGTDMYTGGTTVNAGILDVTTNALPNYATSGVETVNNGGMLALLVSGTNAFTSANVDTLLGKATFNSGSSLGLDTGSGTFTYNTAGINGAEGLTKLGTGTLTLGVASAYSGGTLISAGTVSITATGALGSGGVIDNSTLSFALTSAGTDSNNIGGTGAVTQAGAGIVTLSGNNTYTGATTIAAGDTLNLGSANALAGSTLTNSGTLTFLPSIGTFNIGGLSGSTNLALVDTGSTAVTISVGGNNVTNTYAGIMSGVGEFTKVGTGTQTNSGPSTYTGATTVRGGILSSGAAGVVAVGGSSSFIGASSSAAANLILDGGVLQYTGTSGVGNTDRLFTLTANGGGLDSSSPTGADAFNFTGTGAVALTGAGARTLTFSGSDTTAATFAPLLADPTGGGATSVAKTGVGAWTLTNASNSYSGGTTINAGTLNAPTAGVLGTGAVTFNAGTLNLTGTGTYTNAFNVAGGLVVNASNGATLSGTITGTGAAGTTVRFNTSGATALTITGQLTGATNFEFDSNAQNVSNFVTISNPANNYAGNTIVFNNMGISPTGVDTLALGANNVIPNGAGMGNVQLNANYSSGNTVLQLNNFNDTINGLSTNGGGYEPGAVVQNGATVAGVSALALGDNNANGNFLGVMRNNATAGNTTGTLALTKIGSGTQLLAGVNTYTGGTTVSVGSLAEDFSQVSSTQTPMASNYLAATGTLTLNGGTFQEVGRGNAAAQTLTVTGFTGRNNGITVTAAQAATIQAGQAVIINNNATAYYVAYVDRVNDVVYFNTNSGIANNTTLAQTYAFQALAGANTSQTLAGVAVTGGASGINVNDNGSGAAMLNMGALTRNAGSTLDFVLPNGAQSATNGVTTSTATNGGGVLTSAAGTAFATVSGTTWAGNTQAAGSLFSITPVTSVANNYVNANTDVVASGTQAAFTTNTLRFNTAGTNLNLGGASTVSTGGILVTSATAGANGVSITSTGGTGSLAAGAGNEVVIVNNGNLTVSAPIVNGTAGNSALTISGMGTTTFTGANSYSGTTTINGGTYMPGTYYTNSGTSTTVPAGTTLAALPVGTVYVNNGMAGNGLGTGALVVNNNGTLAGNGTLKNITTTVNGGGTVAPGASAGAVGVLTLTSNVTFTGSSGSLSTLAISFNGASGSMLQINGTLNLSTVNDQITFAGTPTAAVYTLVTATGGITGTFDNTLALPTGYTLSYDTDYVYLTNGTVTVPEPSTWTAGVLMLAAGGYTVRRGRQTAKQAA